MHADDTEHPYRQIKFRQYQVSCFAKFNARQSYLLYGGTKLGTAASQIYLGSTVICIA